MNQASGWDRASGVGAAAPVEIDGQPPEEFRSAARRRLGSTWRTLAGGFFTSAWVAVVYGAAYTWSPPNPECNANDNYAWHLTSNWAVQGMCGPSGCIPATANDDATFDGSASYHFCVVLDANRTIDDVIVTSVNGIEFDAEGQDCTITCDSLVITGTGDITFNEQAEVVSKASFATH